EGKKLKDQAMNIPAEVLDASSCDMTTLLDLKDQLTKLRTNLVK
ncbi:MarR family transcriptional regulator, partial [Acinetobacter sp. GN11]